jgi:quinoprotein glucose dehydrogenase
VQAFDVRTGKPRWIFHTIPRAGEFGYDTWLDDSAEYSGSTNVWAPMAYDPELDYVYLPVSTPTHNSYGGHRPGNNLFAESLVCVEAKTGKRVWHFQTVHHGVWDYDLPAQPILGDITVNGRRIKAVMQISKQAFTYVFDRRTGEPVWPIEERPVPQSTVPGERTSPTQPFPTKPPPFDLQGATEENLIDFTPELKERARGQLRNFEHGPLYTPPSEKGTLFVPGNMGAANWGGAGFDPDTGMLYVPSRLWPWVYRLTASDPAQTDFRYTQGGAGKLSSLMTLDGLPLFKPPYARVTAIDMNKGERAWMAPLGSGPRNHPLLQGLKPGPLGDGIHGGSILVTKTLLFVTVQHLQYDGAPAPPAWAQWGDPDAARKVLYVFDKSSGASLRVIEIDGMAAAAPMTYLHQGKQYIIVAAGAGPSSELIAYSLP